MTGLRVLCMIAVMTLSQMASLSGSYAMTPILPKQGKSLKALVPKGWKLFRYAKGDMNHDGQRDVAFVVRSTMGEKILGLYFWNKNKRAYQKQRQMNHFISAKDDMIDGDPPKRMTISRRGILTIVSFLGGASPAGTYEYRFRYRHHHFEMIGFEGDWRDKKTGEETAYSFNFLTRKVEIRKSNYTNDNPTTRTRKRIALKRLIVLKEMVNGFEFQDNWQLE